MVISRPEAGWQAGPGDQRVTQGISDPHSLRCLENDSSTLTSWHGLPARMT